VAVVCLVLIGLFYAEENWRGKKTLELCKRALKTRGVALDWTNYIPAAVPEDQNIFGVPEMARWFHGRNGAGWKEFTRALPSATYPGLNIDSNTPTMTVAELTIGLRSTSAPDGSTVLRWDDPASRTEAARMINEALGPTARAPQSLIGIGLMLRQLDEVHPARIFLECQTAPSEKELKAFLPDSIIHANDGLSERVLKLELDGDRSYNVTMPRLARAANFLAWSDGLEPQFAVTRRALQRPYAQLQGYYANPNTVPVLDFRSVRNLSQTLGARAQCHLLLGQPGDALDDLTLMHDFCGHILTEQHPATLISAMINQAVRGLYAEQIGEGLRLHAWREPQLAALQEQLKTVDVLPPVKEALMLEAVITYRALDSVPSAGMVKQSVLAKWCPSGWGYQHVADRLNLDFGRLSYLDTANQVVFADKVIAAGKRADALDRGIYTFTGNLKPLNVNRACENTAYNQTRINEALIACALERFRLAHGEYSEKLDDLVPQFLDTIPHDVIGGGPLHYCRATGGTFVLYSVGWNGRDDGGMRGQPPPSTNGDWVWPD
jgi:hypothetical protein